MTTRPQRRRSGGASRRSLQPATAAAAVLGFQLLTLCGMTLPYGLGGGRLGTAAVEAQVHLSDLGKILETSAVAAGGSAGGGTDAQATAAAAAAGGGGNAAAATAAAAVAAAGGGDDGYSALCVVGRNENRYLREWVEYHKCLGFSKIYLYDHNSSVPLLNEISEHVASGFVTYTNYSAAHTKFKEGYTSDLDRFMSTVQGQAYKDCVSRFSSRHTFLGFIDIDEFLVVYDDSIRHVDELLRQYEQHPGLSLYWVLLGSSGHKERPAGLVVDEYKGCTPHNHKFNTQFKTFANTRFRPVMYSPHRAVFAAPPDPKTGLEPYMVDENHNRVPRGRNKNTTHSRAAIYHYVTKSLADFNEKVHRGGGAGVTRPTYYFDLMDKYSRDTCEGAVRTRERFCGGKLPHALSQLAAGGGGAGRR